MSTYAKKNRVFITQILQEHRGQRSNHKPLRVTKSQSLLSVTGASFYPSSKPPHPYNLLGSDESSSVLILTDEAYQEAIKAHTLGAFMIHDVPVNIEDEIVHLSH